MNDDVIRTPMEISKELELINFRSLLFKYPKLKNKKDDFIAEISKAKVKNPDLKNDKVSPATKKAKKNNEPKTQLEAFQQAMKLVFITGQSLGLNPVRGILATDVKEMRFTVCYWRFLHSIIIGIPQAGATSLCIYRLFKGSIAISALGFLSFYLSTCITTFLFIQIASKWPKLIKDISKCRLDEYVDSRIKFKCYMASVLIISFALLEHFLSIFYKVENILSCHSHVNFYEEYLKEQFPWYFDLNVPKNLPIGVFIQIMNIISTVNWNYSDLFIVCVSMYLASILNKINTKIISASEKHYLPSYYWRALREDYNRATRLVRSFDDVISGVVFTSFASNLFFICLQLFNILAHGVNSRLPVQHFCMNKANTPLRGFEYTVYLVFSVTYLFARSLVVSLVAASVNTASLVPAPALYNVPSSAYCDEVARFITQVNEDHIALSGLQFFYVTKELVLTAAGTIVTYELVLLQFSNDEMVK